MLLNLTAERAKESIQSVDRFRQTGVLRGAQGMLSTTLAAAIGELCTVKTADGDEVQAEVIGFEDGESKLMPFAAVGNLRPGATVVGSGETMRVPVGRSLLGRVVNALGEPIDEEGPLHAEFQRPVMREVPAALRRRPIEEPFVTGVRAIDGLLTMGRGQRVGLFAGSGVGKSTLLGDIARTAQSDLNVVAMIGERGREVRPFIQKCLGPEGLQRSVVVVSTADETPLMRVRAAQTAVTIADDFRQRGANVLFMVDSITRMAVAQREIGLMLREPPSARGYTPSVFQLLANTLEGLGNSDTGSITCLATVLVDGDDMDEPIADSVRSIMDGHIVLSRKLAEKAHFPAIDISASISRVFMDVADLSHREAAMRLRELLGTYSEVEDLIRIGLYEAGTSANVDLAVRLQPAMLAFLKQRQGESTTFAETCSVMHTLAEQWQA